MAHACDTYASHVAHARPTRNTCVVDRFHTSGKRDAPGSLHATRCHVCSVHKVLTQSRFPLNMYAWFSNISYFFYRFDNGSLGIALSNGCLCRILLYSCRNNPTSSGSLKQRILQRFPIPKSNERFRRETVFRDCCTSQQNSPIQRMTMKVPSDRSVKYSTSIVLNMCVWHLTEDKGNLIFPHDQYWSTLLPLLCYEGTDQYTCTGIE